MALASWVFYNVYVYTFGSIITGLRGRMLECGERFIIQSI